MELKKLFGLQAPYCLCVLSTSYIRYLQSSLQPCYANESD